jgi:hypothetical protein
MNWLEGDKLELPRGETLKLRYRVVVHAGDTEKANIKDIFHRYEDPASATPEPNRGTQ